MTKKVYINNIIEDFKKALIKKIDNMPEDWDGNEIKQYMSEYFEENYIQKKMDKQRLKNYNNDRIINNL